MLPFQEITREIVVRREAETSTTFGCDPTKRPISELIETGIVNIDKPAGPTSHQVSAYVQKILGIQKTGHSGTLDPGVTGVLPVALERSTKVVQYLLPAGKEYVALMHIHHDIPEYHVRKVFGEFLGEIEQMPPVRSAVVRRLRTRKVYYLEILEIQGKDVLFRAGVQGGTYIRKLIHDMGQKLGCGAHMTELRRTRAGPFDESTLWTLQDVTDAFHYFKEGNETFLRKVIQPVENAVAHLPRVWVFDAAVESLCHGANLNNPGITQLESEIEKNDIVAILTLKGELVAVGEARLSTEEMMASRGFAVKVSRVFMKPGLYPRMER